MQVEHDTDTRQERAAFINRILQVRGHLAQSTSTDVTTMVNAMGSPEELILFNYISNIKIILKNVSNYLH